MGRRFMKKLRKSSTKQKKTVYLFLVIMTFALLSVP